MTDSSRAWCLLVMAAAVLFADAIVAELHGTPAFYASLAREMADSGSALGIFSDDRAYLLKPPLVLWLSAGSMKLLGIGQLSATLVSRLAGIAAVLLCFALVRKLYDGRIAFVAALVLLTNSTFIQFTTTLRMESMMLAGVLLALTGWVVAGERRWASAAVFGGTAIAVLSKGPQGLLPLLLIALAGAMVDPPRFARIRWGWALLLAFPLGWYGWVALHHGLAPFTELTEDFARAAVTPDQTPWQRALVEYVERPLERYWPWLPFMLGGLAAALWRIVRGAHSRALDAWLLAWTALVVGVAAVKPDPDIRYLFLALPPLAAVTAVFIDNWLSPARERGLAVVFLAITVAVGALGALGFMRQDHRAELVTLQRFVAPYTAVGHRPLTIESYVFPPGSPRRQNTQPDWIHFYLGVHPRIAPIGAPLAATVASEPFVLAPPYDGLRERLEALGFEIRITTRKMMLAVNPDFSS